MTDCPNGVIRDQLPEYAAGVLSEPDRARVTAHLDGCDACRAELALVQRARAGYAARAPRVDVAAIVRALPAPRPTVRLSSRWMQRHVWQYATAAGLLLAVGGGVVLRRGVKESAAWRADTTVARVISETTSAAKAAVPDAGMTFGGGLSDLSLDELQALSGQMDSVRTLPSKDPESVTLVIANEGGTTQ